MRQVAAGDHGAFTSLYRQQAALLLSVTFTILRDREAAEDVVQESFIQMWRKAPTYDADRSSVSTWSVTIARHKAIDKLRSRLCYSRATQAVAAENNLQLRIYAKEKTDRRIQHNEERDRVQNALRKIGDGQREAISLAFLVGLTYPQIAEQLNAPLATVKSRIRRGLFALREVLEGDQ